MIQHVKFSQTDLGNMIKIADCIIWDEAVMTHRHVFMAVERTLKDIMTTADPESTINDTLFGNKRILFGGDFRQVLPVVKKGNRSAIVNSTIKNAPFWKEVTQFKLTINMRIKSAAINSGVDESKLNSFSEFLLAIGEGRMPFVKESKYTDEIQLPKSISKNMDEQQLLKQIYPNIMQNYLDSDFMCSRAILAGKNRDVNRINEIAADYFPGDSKIYLSADTVLDAYQRNIFPTEFLNKINDSSLPPHRLTLKLNQPIILLRNVSLSPKRWPL